MIIIIVSETDITHKNNQKLNPCFIYDFMFSQQVLLKSSTKQDKLLKITYNSLLLDLYVINENSFWP